LQPKGSDKKKIVEQLKEANAKDKHYQDGKILCSMCTIPHPLAEKAYRMFLESNLGDAGLFPGTVQLEKESIKALAELLHCKNAGGFIVSGGTEANLLALLAARNIAKVKEPEVVLPQSAHFSFTKICGMLNIKPIYADLDETFKVDPKKVEECLSKNTVAVVGTAGTTELGAVDPIEELGKIASDYKVFLHVDAAFGGLVIPFLSENKPKFDFKVDGVESITVDPHKMGMAAIPAGGILFKETKNLDLLKTQTPYLSEDAQYTIVGTRSGASAASTWAVFKALGIEGFEKVINKCMKNTQFLAGSLKKAGFKLVIDPQLNLVCFRGKNTKCLAESLWAQGWCVSYVPRHDCIRIVVMPHVKKQHLANFLSDLQE
jgi:tyrosine decarboxylase/aspartate 1-decarboxylase